jgi:hypothetical protein
MSHFALASGLQRVRCSQLGGSSGLKKMEACNDWATLFDALASARGGAGSGGDSIVVVRLPNHRLWAFSVLPTRNGSA